MSGGKTARAAVSVLTALLFVLPFLALTAPFASAHTARHAAAGIQPGNVPSGMAPRDETATCQETGRPGALPGPLRVRDRHRTASVPAAEGPERPLCGPSTEAAHAQTAPGAARPRAPRPPDDHSPAALQVFRC
ncbi:hypothetical protein SUDANB58_04622 [Streptomyces sp. enrichment culture]|uniref:hypothetical protein n=1 Tax=Streptomyces sp. enrichment culture TaxID=1795815 RepID=UPI003F55F72F